MAANVPKVLLRSEDSSGHVAVVELTVGGRVATHGDDS
jgi:hypothetical protein